MFHFLLVVVLIWLAFGTVLAIIGKTGFDIEGPVGEKAPLKVVLLGSLILIVISPVMMIHSWTQRD